MLGAPSCPVALPVLTHPTGEQHDAESGLVYLRARSYDPASGRFLQPDPLGLGGGDHSLYAYAGNRPTLLTDPRGEIPAGAAKCIFGGMIVGGLAMAATRSPAGGAIGGVVGCIAGVALIPEESKPAPTPTPTPTPLGGQGASEASPQTVQWAGSLIARGQ